MIYLYKEYSNRVRTFYQVSFVIPTRATLRLLLKFQSIKIVNPNFFNGNKNEITGFVT